MVDFISKIEPCDCPSLGAPIIRIIHARGRHDSANAWFVDYKWSDLTVIGNSADGTHCADAVPFGSALSGATPLPPAKPIDFEDLIGYVDGSDPVVWVERQKELFDDGTYTLGPWLNFGTSTPYTGGGAVVPTGGGAPSSGGPEIESQSGWAIDANGAWHFYSRVYDESAGTWEATSYSDAPGGNITTPVLPLTPAVASDDRELISFCYDAIAAGSGYVVGDKLELISLFDTASSTPEIPIQRWWVNKSQGTTLAFASVPFSDVQPCAPETATPTGRYTETYRLDGDLTAVATAWIRTNSAGVTPQVGVPGNTVSIPGPFQAIHANILRGAKQDSLIVETDAAWGASGIGYRVGLGDVHPTQLVSPAADSGEMLSEGRSYRVEPGCAVEIHVIR